MNAQLQVLYFNEKFRANMFRWTSSDEESKDRWIQITKHLQTLFAGLHSSKRRSLNPTRFVNALNLQTGTQQDAQEFNKLLMEQLETIFKKATLQSVREFIPNQFCGKIKYTMKCQGCSTESHRKESFYELRVPIERDHDVEMCLSKIFAMEYFTDSNKYMCSVCKMKQDAVRMTRIAQAPEILNLQLMRFVYVMWCVTYFKIIWYKKNTQHTPSGTTCKRFRKRN